MKQKILLVSIGALLMLCVAAIERRSSSIFIFDPNNDNEIKLTVRTAATQSAPMIELDKAGVTVFTVNANGGITCQGIQTGTYTTSADGTVTNTFPVVYSANPAVQIAATGTVYSPTNAILSINATNFIVKCGAPNVTGQWFAYGLP